MILNKYKKYFLNGDWHTHSTFSDGKNTPEEMVKAAISMNLELIAITDHVNRKTDWLDEFSEEINRLKNKYKNQILILSGIEAKAIDLKGNIDARVEFFDKIDIALGAIHRIPTTEGFMPKEQISKRKDEALTHWNKTILTLLKNPNVDIIAHPTNLLSLCQITVPSTMKKEIAGLAKEKDKAFESNIKYQVPDKEFIELLKENNVSIVKGSDAHDIEELKKFQKKSVDKKTNLGENNGNRRNYFRQK